MSRIHEALKKAEQERSISQTGTALPVSPTPAEMPAGIRRDEDSYSVRESAIPVAEASFPADSRSFAHAHASGPDAVLSRCALMQWKPQEKTMLFFNGNDAGRGMEEFRTLRSRLYHAREKMPLRRILVTSALPKEGKSFTAANLAQVMARQQGRRVLLVDADLRSPRLHSMFGTVAVPGLSDYLKGSHDEFAVMQRGPMENLFFIPSGTDVSEPAELVSNDRFKLLMQRLEPLFEWIIVDSPPAVPVSDASILAKACEGVLLVTRSNSTPADVARRAREEFSEQALVGVVLNGINQEAGYSQYYYETYVRTTTESKS
jgi:protein-tyrosine kinase